MHVGRYPPPGSQQMLRHISLALKHPFYIHVFLSVNEVISKYCKLYILRESFSNEIFISIAEILQLGL